MLPSALPPSPPFRSLPLSLIYVVVSIYWLILIPFRISDPVEGARRALNDLELMKGEKGQCYIYGENDPMVGWPDGRI